MGRRSLLYRVTQNFLRDTQGGLREPDILPVMLMMQTHDAAQTHLTPLIWRPWGMSEFHLTIIVAKYANRPEGIDLKRPQNVCLQTRSGYFTNENGDSNTPSRRLIGTVCYGLGQSNCNVSGDTRVANSLNWAALLRRRSNHIHAISMPTELIPGIRPNTMVKKGVGCTRSGNIYRRF